MYCDLMFLSIQDIEGRGVMARAGRFSEKTYIMMFLSSQRCDIASMFVSLGPWTRQFTLTCFNLLKCKLVPCMAEMAMCTIS